MDGENDSVEVVVQRQGKLISEGIEYSLLCQRKSRTEAEKVKAGLIQDGCKAKVVRNNGVCSVWWFK